VEPSVKCDVCSAGKFQDETDGKFAECKVCPGGYFISDPGQDEKKHQVQGDCLQCGPGQISDSGAQFCYACAVGRRSFVNLTNNKSSCIDCTAGFYQDTTVGNSTCKECLAGFYQNVPAKPFCLPCVPGFYQNLNAQSGCKKCEVGQYLSATEQVICKKCPIGFSQNDEGQASCIPCSPGEFNDATDGAAKCKLCAESTYFGAKGRNSRCIDCPVGWTSVQGSAKCQACVAGTFGKGCQLCPVGYARNGTDDDATQCRLCRLGETTSIPGAATCEKCDLGKKGSRRGECSDCPVGRYQDTKGETSCKECDVDTYLSETGKSSKADCVACDSERSTGTSVANTNATSCLCRRGDFYQNEKRECLPCPAGADCTKKDGLLLSELSAVPGYYRENDFVVVFEKCHTKEDCVGGRVQDQCRNGTTGVLCAVCIDGYIRIDGTCSQCPPDVSTDGTTALLLVSTVPPFLLFVFLALYLSLSREGGCCSSEAEKEEIKSNITKVSPATVSALPTRTPDRNNITKVSPVTVPALPPKPKKKLKRNLTNVRTAVSISHYSSNDESKNQIAEVVAEQITGMVEETVEENVNEIGGATGGEIEIDTGRISRKVTIRHDAPGLSIRSWVGQIRKFGHRVRILIGYLQISSALVFSFDVPWPPETLRLLKSLTFINFNFMDFFQPLEPCMLYTPFLKQATFHMAILPLCGLTVLAAGVVALKCNKPSVVWPRAKSVMVTLVFLLYPGICTRVFTTFKCQRIGDRLYFMADYSHSCFEGEHQIVVVLMYMCMGLFVLGIPIGSTLVLYFHKKLHRVDETASPELQARGKRFETIYGALYDAYEPKYWWFESAIMINKALLTGGLVLVAPGTSVQILVGLVLALGFSVLLMQTKPYEDDDDDKLQTIATVSTVSTLLIGFALKVDRKAEGEAGEFDTALLDIILIGLFVGVGVSGVYMMLKSLPCLDRSSGGDDNSTRSTRSRRLEKKADEEKKTEIVPVVKTRKKKHQNST
jgi:hypothetical protein